MEKDIEISLKNLILAGIGGIAATCDKSQVLFNDLVEKGKEAVEQGKVKNEELKNNLKEKLRENVTVSVVKAQPAGPDEILEAIKNLSPKEREELQQKLETKGNSNDKKRKK